MATWQQTSNFTEYNWPKASAAQCSEIHPKHLYQGHAPNACSQPMTAWQRKASLFLGIRDSSDSYSRTPQRLVQLSLDYLIACMPPPNLPSLYPSLGLRPRLRSDASSASPGSLPIFSHKCFPIEIHVHLVLSWRLLLREAAKPEITHSMKQWLYFSWRENITCACECMPVNICIFTLCIYTQIYVYNRKKAWSALSR